MPWTGTAYVRNNGVFTGPLVWTDDRDAGTKITAAHHDTHDQDIADGITACINKNGANSPTTDISWGSHKIIALGYGSNNTDAAAYGQTTTSLTLNPATNVLTAARPDGTTYDVDLSALAVGGSTDDFARYSNANNPFQGTASFGGPVKISNAWTFAPTTGITFTVSNTNGANLVFSGNAGAAQLRVNGSPVWTEATLPPGTLTGVLTASGNYTITGAWTFTNPSLKLVPYIWASATGGGNWTAGPDSGTQLSFTAPDGLHSLVFSIDAGPIAGAALDIGTKRAWETGSLRSGLTTAPTGGEDGNLAVVQSGADRGLWTRIGGVWTKLIAFP